MNSTVRFLGAAVFAAASLLSAGAHAATPAAGVEQQIRSGFFADVNMGGFFTLGGKNSKEQSRPSNAQAYLQLGIGYDIAKNVSLGASFGLGASASSCFATVAANGDCVGKDENQKKIAIADNFTATIFTGTISYKYFFNDRLTLQPRLHLGYAALDPEPRRNENGAPITGGFVAGAALAVEYATHMDHFSIGADVAGRLIAGPNIFTLAFFPKIKYTF